MGRFHLVEGGFIQPGPRTIHDGYSRALDDFLILRTDTVDSNRSKHKTGEPVNDVNDDCGARVCSSFARFVVWDNHAGLRHSGQTIKKVKKDILHFVIAFDSCEKITFSL